MAGYTLEPTHQSVPRRRKVTGFAREFEEPRCGLHDPFIEASVEVRPLVARFLERFAIDERQRISKRVKCRGVVCEASVSTVISSAVS